jgi:hypothetical protein
VDGHDRRAATLRDSLHAAPERIQQPRPRELSLREDADDLALVEALARVASAPRRITRGPPDDEIGIAPSAVTNGLTKGL